jgi:hypothetical protein
MDDPQSIDEQLRFAIADKRLLEVGYHGNLRVAEPHDYGVQNGAAKLLTYQLRKRDDGRWMAISGWRMLEVSKIE